MLEQNITLLTQELGISLPAPQENGSLFFLEISPTLKISCKSLSPGVFFSSPIAPLPKQQRESALTHVLKANFLGQGTGSMVIGIDEAEQYFTLSYVSTRDVNYKSFKDLLEEFTNYLSYWQEELQKYTKTKESGIL